jgi:hypothetical protein
MQIKSSLTAFIVAASLIVSATPLALGQQPSMGDWSVVQSLSPDERIVISLKSGKEVKGKFLDAAGNEITILRKGKHESFARDTVAQIHHVKGTAKKGQWALIGSGIGAGTGFGIGQAKNSPPVDDGGIYPVMGTIIGAGIGAASGFLFGETRRHRVLIY